MVAYDVLSYTTNADAIEIKGTIYAVNTLLFLPPLVQEMIENVGGIKYHYFKVTFRVAGDANLHVDQIDDRGYLYLNASGNQAEIFLNNTNNVKPNTPYPLDGAGHKKASASDTPYSWTFLPYESVSWGIDFS